MLASPTKHDEVVRELESMTGTKLPVFEGYSFDWVHTLLNWELCHNKSSRLELIGFPLYRK
jgi:hypothetical protein